MSSPFIGGTYLGACIGFAAVSLVGAGLHFNQLRQAREEARSVALKECAEASTSESPVKFFHACRAKGGEPRLRLWSELPTMICEVTTRVKP